MPLLYQIDKVNSRNIFTKPVIYLSGQKKDHSAMTNTEVRRENARLLAAKVGGEAKFAKLLDMDASQVSHIIGKTPLKGIGNIIARRIEDKFALPRGWLDSPHFEAPEPAAKLESVAIAQQPTEEPSVDQVIELITLFEQATVRGRENILDLARSAAKRGDARWKRVIDNEG